MKTNQIYHGDCLDLLPSIPDKSIDMILCDLPYGTTACSWDSIIPLDRLWAEYARVIKDNGNIVLTAQGVFCAELICYRKTWFNHDYVWIKNMQSNLGLTGIQPHRYFENVLVFRPPRKYAMKKKQTYLPYTFNFDDRVKRQYEYKGKNRMSYSMYGNDDKPRENKIHIKTEYENYPRNTLYFDCERGQHPTQKPVALFEYLIRTYSNEGEVILDNCSGSGTTAIACLNSNRQFICMEKDETYYKASLERIANHEPLLNLGK